MVQSNIVRHKGKVTGVARATRMGQRGVIVWLTGLSGSGKSTVAYELEAKLHELGHTSYTLDGDNIRHGLNSDLGFSPSDREENIRRIGEVAALFADANLIAITSFISPYIKDRERARQLAGKNRFVEVYLDVPLEVCESRDPKGLYAKARSGDIPNFTGISAPYEVPENPEIRLETNSHSPSECADQIISYLAKQGFLSAE